MLNKIAISVLIFFSFAELAHAEFIDVPPQQLINYLESHQKVIVLFDSSDPKCTACEPKDGGPFMGLSNDFGSSVKFVRVRWASPWWKLPPELNPIFKQQKFFGIPAVVGFSDAHTNFIEMGRLQNTESLKEKIASMLKSSPK